MPVLLRRFIDAGVLRVFRFPSQLDAAHLMVRLRGIDVLSLSNLMSKKVVLVTSALSGIGRATAFAYAKMGAGTIVSGRNEAPAVRTA